MDGMARFCNEAVVKIVSRCNINCSYCYMYHKGDESYKLQPKLMSPEVATAFFTRVRSHCLEHNIATYYIALHGGEPLLAGKEFIRNFVTQAREILLPEVTPRFALQTNGILLDNEWYSLFNELEIALGISIDLVPSSHDKYRVDHKGKGTYERVVAGFKKAETSVFNKENIGVLGVMDIDTDPMEVYDHYASLGIAKYDLLFPDNTYEDLPPGLKNFSSDRFNTPYANWLIQLFDRWFHDEKRPRIRLFKHLVDLILGKKIGFDFLGTDVNRLIVVETDGSIEPVDSLKICGDSFTKANLNVLTHTIDEALQTDLLSLFFNYRHTLPAQCVSCPVNHICAGGFLPHRYSREKGFDNPTLYCLDFMKFIIHVQNVIVAQFTAEQLEEMNIEAVSFEEVRDTVMELV
jgi:uncharacterized protein